MTSSIPASDIAAAGTAQVTVFNPSPGGGTSAALTFTINLPPGVIERVSVASDGSQGNSSSDFSSISAAGRFVAFESGASNLVAGDTNAATDVFVRDTCLGAPVGCVPATSRVSVASDGSQGNSFSQTTSLSADGRFVGFHSRASTLVAGDTNGFDDVFVRDTCLGALAGCVPSTVRVSLASDGTQGNNLSEEPSLSADGRFVAFESVASNLVAGDTNGSIDIFVRDTCVGAPAGCVASTVRVSVASDGSQSTSHSFEPSISADGRFVAFSSGSENLVAGDTNLALDSFVRDTCVGAAAGCVPTTVRVSVANDGTQGNSHSLFPSVSADGRFVAFTSAASNLVGGDTNNLTDVFLARTGF